MNTRSPKMSSNDSSNAHYAKPDNYQVNAKICRLVERHPCMYDRSHPHYLKKDVVDKAWIKIAKEMDDSIPASKERWRNIRTSFARSINVNKVPASANRTKPYYLHEELKFLARHITPGIPISRRSNAYYSAGEESEVIEVSVGEESFDDFAARVRDEGEDSRDQQSSNEGFEEAAKNESQLQLQQMPATPEQEHEPEAIYIVPPKKRQRMVDMLPSATLMLPAEGEHECEREREREREWERERERELEMEREREREKEREREREREHDVKPSDLPVPDSDFDALFLQSLLPEIKAMDFCQKIKFKRRIYDVIGEIFESTTSVSSVNSNTVKPAANTSISPTTTSNISMPTMTLVNSADLAMIRRLNTLLLSPTVTTATSSSAITAMPKNVASISSTVGPTSAASPTVALHRGALTRSSSTLLRVTMLNSPSSTAQSQAVKQEPNGADD